MSESNGHKPYIVVIMPHRNGQGNLGAGMAMQAAFKQHEFVHTNEGHSLLPFAFNRLWCQALNLRTPRRATHVLMLHNDVCPDPGFGDVLMDELNATGADMLSVVVPIKDARGITSTAVEDASDPWACRRVTMHEVFAMPETFGALDLPWHNLTYGRLLLNTGCWLVRLGPWVHAINPVTGHRPWFRQQDCIVARNGEDVARSWPEDWDWSRQLQDMGLRILATRKVPLYHEVQEWHNRSPWGTQRTDLGYLQWKKQEREALAANPVTEPEMSCL